MNAMEERLIDVPLSTGLVVQMTLEQLIEYEKRTAEPEKKLKGTEESRGIQSLGKQLYYKRLNCLKRELELSEDVGVMLHKVLSDRYPDVMYKLDPDADEERREKMLELARPLVKSQQTIQKTIQKMRKEYTSKKAAASKKKAARP